MSESSEETNVEGFEFRISPAFGMTFHSPRVELRILNRKRRMYASALVVTKPEDDCCSIPALMEMREHETQSLMDQLWLAGVRPSDKILPIRNDAAVEKHLQDMRAIVADQLGIPTFAS